MRSNSAGVALFRLFFVLAAFCTVAHFQWQCSDLTVILPSLGLVSVDLFLFSRDCAQVLHEVTFLASPGRQEKTG